MFLSRYERSKLDQIRLGIFPIRLETGRYSNEKLEDRLCTICKNGNIEDELHFIFECNAYTVERQTLYNNVNMPLFDNFNNNEKLIILIQEYPRQLSKFFLKSYLIRRSILYG